MACNNDSTTIEFVISDTSWVHIPNSSATSIDVTVDENDSTTTERTCTICPKINNQTCSGDKCYVITQDGKGSTSCSISAYSGETLITDNQIICNGGEVEFKINKS
jgi:hypothetical protein